MGSELRSAAQCDWLTLASYRFKAYTDAAAYLRKTYDMKWKPAKWLQYDGFQTAGIFYGKAIQSHGKEHYIIKGSGIIAWDLHKKIMAQPFAENWYATRIDIERTILKPKWWKPRKLYDELKAAGIVTSLIESTTGSTVYVGSRSSGRFVRLYEKELMTLKHVRLEIELKQGHSRRAWEIMLDGGTLRSLYAAHLLKVKLPGYVVDTYMPDDREELDLTLAQREDDNDKKLKWLKSLIPTFEKMCLDHSMRIETRSIFYSLLVNTGDSDYDNPN